MLLYCATALSRQTPPDDGRRRTTPQHNAFTASAARRDVGSGPIFNVFCQERSKSSSERVSPTSGLACAGALRTFTWRGGNEPSSRRPADLEQDQRPRGGGCS